MNRPAAVTFKGVGMTLVGPELKVGTEIPPFELHYYDAGMKTLGNKDLKGKPTLVSVVPSLDTKVCAIQTKRFFDELSKLGDSVNAVTVSLDLPFAQGRFCSENGITMRVASDYQNRSFGNATGLLIDELKLLARAVVVLDKNGKVVYIQTVPEVTDEPDYDKAMAALQGQV